MPDVDDTPEFREIPDFGGYEVTRDGRMRSIWADGRPKGNDKRTRREDWRYLNPGTDHKGYYVVSMVRNDGIRKWVKLHKVVLMTWCGPRPEGMQGCHRDDDKANNHIDNLYWGTSKQNKADAIRDRRHAHGETNHTAKLTDDDIREIFRLHSEGMRNCELAGRFGVSKPNICNILKRRLWKHVDIPA